MSIIKTGLCNKIKSVKELRELSYTMLTLLAEEDGYILTRSQISAIITKEGSGVSMETLEKLCSTLGLEIELNIK